MWCCLQGYGAILFAPINLIIYVLGFITLAVAIMKVILGPDGFESARYKGFAFLMSTMMKKMNVQEKMQKIRAKVLEPIKEVQSADATLRKEGVIRILEIGVGAGENLEHYPAGARLVCVDPNPAFEAYFRQECATSAAHLHPDVKFVVECGEDMISVKDESVDVVVMTLVMCSVDEVSRLVREIRRVLVPGGKLLFMEHTADARGTWRRTFQNLVSDSGLWPALVGGCRLNKTPVQVLEDAGFASVEHTLAYVNMDTCRLQSEYVGVNGPFALGNPIIYGTATK